MTIHNAEHSRSRPMTEPPATVRSGRGADVDDWDPDSELSETSKSAIATVFGLALLIAAFAVIGRLGGWAADYGTILVYLAFFLWMSIAGRVFWWGADKLIAAARKKSNTGDRR
ncbi:MULTISPECIES: hypothetical protein [Rhodococcus]|uniref:hypothetical protein n=1 Tax=Rhodococcus TaxID=1827 RepID=UPI0008062F42|nr:MULTISPECIES: hypothetical protein [Rhodococcus]ANQ73261.1 hypothetical protein AOT96_22225 [Rhodococcus sp. 008]MCZ4543765.1 hypothetical protein [Rhodococcus qingshengii]OKA09148.1 hypothetical protein BS618_31275 [Rhodococcus erythropolis]UGQ53313.1 hypothetical protein LRL17_06205 [Rhodococcus qingshengii]